MKSNACDELRRRALEPASLVADGNYTRPRSWGVYRLPEEAALTSERFRAGNHPIRQIELQRDFGSAALEWLFGDRDDALLMKRLLNGK